MRLTPEEAITAATINAAHACGMANKVGSIELGKIGDVILLDAPNYLHLPYRFGTNLVSTVIKAGRIING